LGVKKDAEACHALARTNLNTALLFATWLSLALLVTGGSTLGIVFDALVVIGLAELLHSCVEDGAGGLISARCVRGS
jgi:hypothetical protein